MQLVEPSSAYKSSFIDAVKEFQAKPETDDRGNRYKELSISDLESNFDRYVSKEKSHSRGENLPEGYVPVTTYWLIDNGEYIGRASIRHKLTEHLRTIGGHIGYDIRPSKRRHGYGTKILQLALSKAKELGISKALVTCDESNLASRKIIEKNGGDLESKELNPDTGIAKLRFWIDIR